MSSSVTLLSIVITAYNWPEALERVLLALDAQQGLPFEVLVADDGSKPKLAALIERLRPQLHYPILHVWQPDDGFRPGMARNKAIAQSSGDYVAFLDHDMIPSAAFISAHFRHAAPGCFVSSSRIYLEKELTAAILNGSLNIFRRSFFWFLKQSVRGRINRVSPMLRLPLGPLRFVKKNKWRGTRNQIGVWKKDLVSVDGYDEAYVGWGYEDSDLVVRLLKSGVKRKIGQYSGNIAFHLDHPVSDRAQESVNKSRFLARLDGSYVDCKGLSQYLSESALEKSIL